MAIGHYLLRFGKRSADFAAPWGGMKVRPHSVGLARGCMHIVVAPALPKPIATQQSPSQ
jgi:hypothetical protein